MSLEPNIRSAVEDVVGQILAGGEVRRLAEMKARDGGLTAYLISAADAGTRCGEMSADAAFALKAAAILLEASRDGVDGRANGDDSAMTERLIDLFDRYDQREMGLRLLDNPHDFLRWFVAGCNQLNVFRLTSAADVARRMRTEPLVTESRRSVRRSYQVLLDAGW